MDKFVQYTAGGGCADKSIVMDYYDGNTVTGLWNLAQHFALSDNSFDTQFGPSTPRRDQPDLRRNARRRTGERSPARSKTAP